MKRQLILLSFILLLIPAVQAQNKQSRESLRQRHTAMRAGNKEMKAGHISKAITNYRTALKADSTYAHAQFNQAYALARRNQLDSAMACYKKVVENPKATNEEKARAHYNAGNIYLKSALTARDSGRYDAQGLKAAIEQYKASLRLDGNNSNAKHNLSLAKKLLRPEQNQSQNQNQNQNQDQNQNQQQKQQQKQQQNQDQNNNQNQDQKNKKDQNNQNQNQNNNQNQQNKDKQNGDRKNQNQDQKQQEQRRREAEQMLNAMKNNEQQTMRAVRMKEMGKERRQGDPNRIEKDW